MSCRGKLILCLLSALALCGCAALNPSSATGPRTTGAAYPIFLVEDSQRKEATGAALGKLAQLTANGTPTDARLQPVTGTILGFPNAARTGLYLPKVGAGPSMSEEETRESLRRFIREWEELIGADPLKLSLVERSDLPDGSKVAKYEQRPFRYPIRGNYGKLQITFAADRRIIDVNSTCIPDADRLQTAFSNLTFPRRASEAVKQLTGKNVSYVDSTGAQMSFVAPGESDLIPKGLVVYILPAKSGSNALEFHIAWEIELKNGPVKLVYVDAVNSEVFATALS